jgi:hypothetical protein
MVYSSVTLPLAGAVAGADELQFCAARLQARGLNAVGTLEGDGEKPGVRVAGFLAFFEEGLEEVQQAGPVGDCQELGNDAVVWGVAVLVGAELGHVAVEPGAGGEDKGGVEVLFFCGEDSIEYFEVGCIDIDAGGGGCVCSVGRVCKRPRVGLK